MHAKEGMMPLRHNTLGQLKTGLVYEAISEKMRTIFGYKRTSFRANKSG